MLLNAIIEQSKFDFQFLMHDLELHLLIGGYLLKWVKPHANVHTLSCNPKNLNSQHIKLKFMSFSHLQPIWLLVFVEVSS
jgi:hypothetical protein